MAESLLSLKEKPFFWMFRHITRQDRSRPRFETKLNIYSDSGTYFLCLSCYWCDLDCALCSYLYSFNLSVMSCSRHVCNMLPLRALSSCHCIIFLTIIILYVVLIFTYILHCSCLFLLTFVPILQYLFP